jgi:hypothetical protein
MPYIILILVGLLWLKTYPALDPDFGWHLALGKEMIAKKDLIHNFVGYNYFENVKIIDHQWLSDILLYLGYHHVGYWFLAVISFAITLLIFLLLYRLILLSKATPAVAGIVISLTILSASIVFCGVRLQYLLLLAAVLLPYIFKTVRPFWLRLLYYFLIFALGCNLHGGFLTLTPIPFLLELSILKFSKAVRKKSFISLLILSAVLLLSFCTSPYGVEYWKYILTYLTDSYYRSHISEWLPIYAYPVYWFQVIFPLSLVIFVFTVDKYWKKINKIELLMLAIFFYLGITSLRAFPIFMLLVAPYFVGALSDLLSSLKADLSKVKYITTVFLILLAVYLAAAINPIDFRKSIFDLDTGYPKEALTYLSENPPADGNIFNNYGWGGYQTWTHPELKVFIDGRNPGIIAADSKSFLEIYNDFFTGDDTQIEANLTKYNISVVMLKKPEITTFNKFEKILYEKTGSINIDNLNKKSDLLLYLETSDKWIKVYSDDKSDIWKRAS